MGSVATDFTMFLYNFGVVLSGAYVVMEFGIDQHVSMLGIAFGLAIVWTIYFRHFMRSRLAEIERE